MSFQVYKEIGHNIIRIDTGTHNTVPIILDLLKQRDIRRE